MAKNQKPSKSGVNWKKIRFIFPVPKSHTQMGSLSAKNVSEKFSRLGTFNLINSSYSFVLPTGWRQKSLILHVNSGQNTSWLWPQSIHTQYMQRRTKECTVIAKPRRHVCTVHKFLGIVLKKKIRRVIFSWHVLGLYICRSFVLWTISDNSIHVQNKLCANAIRTNRTLN